MNDEVYSFALKNTLNEIKNVCPDVSNTFIFKNGKILAKDETTTEENIKHTINAFNGIAERADALGELQTVTFQGSKARVNIACQNDFYLTTVASKEADEKYVATLTRVLIPTVIKLVDKLHPATVDAETVTTEAPEPVMENDNEEVTDKAIDEEDCEKELPVEDAAPPEPIEEQPEPEIDTEPLLPEPPVTQFIVENLGGLLVPSDTVRIDNTVIMQWSDLYGDKKIEEVDLETLNGKTTRCKFKPIKDSKFAGKGIIQMPEKIQLTLDTAKGELVMAKPVIE